MNEKDFQSAVIQGADDLLEMMGKNPAKYNKVAQVIAPPKPSPTVAGVYRLKLNDYVRDGAIVYLNGKAYSEIEIKKLYMTKANKYAYVYVPHAVSHTFLSCPFKKVTLETDMRFLIENMKEFYKNHSLSFSPPAPGFLPPANISLDYPLSAQQSEAVSHVLSSSVSYTWGAPGTGKTKAVLATCLLRYILSKRRVLLLAPTNNAIEQALRAILPILEQNRVPLAEVYRVGTASYEFAAEYPQVVGDRSLEDHAKELTQKILSLKKELSLSREHEEKLSNLQKKLEAMAASRDQVRALLDLLEQTIDAYSGAENRLHVSQCSQLKATKSHKSATAAFESRQDLIDKYDQSIKSNLIRIRDIRFFPWKYAEGKKLRVQNQMLEIQKQGIMLTLHDYLAKADAAKAQLDAALAESREAGAEYQSVLDSYESVKKEIRAVFIKIGVELPSELTPNLLESAFRDSYSAASQESVLLHGVSFRQTDAIQAELNDVSAKSLEVCSHSKLEQFRNALLVASTFDSAISHLPKLENAQPYSHIFIDEAGYASLARGMIAFSCGCPVAFFGDHFQLPPICEMKTTIIQDEYPAVTTWALPVVAYSDLICFPLENLIPLLDSLQYSFSKLTFSRLLKSYRFGESLAKILDNFIYRTQQLEGVGAHPLKITILHGKKEPTDHKRASTGEVAAIKKFLTENPLPIDTFVILAPYNAQIEKLKKELTAILPNGANDILSVHRSQGLEWDTVILSVCDTKEAYFVDSKRPIGRSVLNTAISRTKKHLVITCDTSFWSKENEQLITNLVSLA